MDSAAHDWDVIVLGLGPGGEEVAGTLATEGRSVLGIDERLVGGECPYFGCIPSKMVLRGAGPVFCAGHDLSEMNERSPEFYRHLFDVCTVLMETIQAIRQPDCSWKLTVRCPVHASLTRTASSRMVPLASRKSGSAPTGNSRRSTWSAVHLTVATVVMPSRW